MKGCHLVYLAIGVLILIMLNNIKREGLVEQSQSQYDCAQLGKSDCASSNTCMWKLDNTCQPDPSKSESSY